MNERSCTREGCQVAQTGKCLEAFEPPADCPYLVSGGVSTAEIPGSTGFVTLPSGEALSEIQASDVTREGPTKVVVLAGPHGSGKTTILTSLFDAFLEAPLANFLFAGSRTLVGFERRCHDSREESGRTAPHTAHTPVSDVVDFLHLKLASAISRARRQNLLLSDISGERFRALRDSADAVRKMTMLYRADYLCIVVDGEKLADQNQRQIVRTDARMLLRSLIEAQALSPSCKLQVIFSKWDAVSVHPDHQSLMSFTGDIKTTLEELAANVGIEFVEVAARPKNRQLPFAFGLPSLLRSWLKDPVPVREMLYLPSADRGAREFTRFATSVAKAQHFEDSYDVQWI